MVRHHLFTALAWACMALVMVAPALLLTMYVHHTSSTLDNHYKEGDRSSYIIHD